MEVSLGGLAFAGVIAAHFLAVVAAHSARWTSGEPSPSRGISRRQWALAVAIVALLSPFVIAGAPRPASAAESNAARAFPIQCANRHVHALTLIEHLGNTPDFAGDQVAKAMLAIIDARRVCAEGSEATALSLYDKAVLELVFRDEPLREGMLR
jgi:hypothetical protein